ncbi:hypothetical protein WDU99_01710 [Microbacterium sp. Mu-80]|uniref:Uncharacterized protein n=1 Tax=Microbacterium bandirmense TaxID=3122050 RepID=A0ABU8L6S8_9MICO
MATTSQHVCPPDHPHNNTCYLRHGCRDHVCKARRAEGERLRRREKAYGTYTRALVDAGPVRQHLAWLREHGMGAKYIAAASGVSFTVITGIIWRSRDRNTGELTHRKRIRSDTAARLLAVRPDLNLLADGAFIDATGYRRRLQALVAHGWTLPAIARTTNGEVSEFRLSRWIHANLITAANARTIITIFDRLELATPPHTTAQERAWAQRARRLAMRRRWAPALAWDDIDTDPTPPAVEQSTGNPLDEIAIELALAGNGVRLTPGERRVCVRKLHSLRWSDQAIAERLRCADRTVERIRNELDLTAWQMDELEVTKDAA